MKCQEEIGVMKKGVKEQRGSVKIDGVNYEEKEMRGRNVEKIMKKKRREFNNVRKMRENEIEKIKEIGKIS